jgi:hypothetical protein
VHGHEKGLCLFGIIALLALLFLLLWYRGISGAAVAGCSQGYTSAGPYCVEDACKVSQCIRDGNLIKLPDCVCAAYLGRFRCGIKGGDWTAVKTPLCTRAGQLNKVCGFYDSRIKRCVVTNITTKK